MPNTRLLFTALLGLLVGCASASPSNAPATAADRIASEKLHLVADRFPPFMDTSDQPRVAIDLVTTALARAGYIAETEILPIDQVIQGLVEKRFAGSSALWRSEGREEFLLYSDPYLENRLLLVARKDTPVDAKSFAELAGKRVGVVEGYAYGPELEAAKEPTFVRGPSTEESFHALLRGELDYVLVDALLMHHIAHQYPKETSEKLALGEHTLITRALHLTVRKDLPNAQVIVERFNRELAKMLQDGSYHQALKVDWIRADVDGDGTLEMVAAGDEVGQEAPRTGYKLSTVQGTGPSSDQPEGNARFVIKGVPYGSWDAVPEEYKRTPSSPMGNSPGTLRASVFEF